MWCRIRWLEVEVGRGQELSRMGVAMRSGIGCHGNAGSGRRDWWLVMFCCWNDTGAACLWAPLLPDYVDVGRTSKGP